MKRFFSILLSTILCACGGGSDAETVVQPAVRVAAYGDSTTYGTTYQNGNWVQSPSNVPVVLQTMFGLELGAGKVAVENHGIPGATSVSGPWSTQISSSGAHVIAISFGINDALLVSLDDYRAALDGMVQAAKATGKAVVIETPNPVGDAKYAALPDYAQVARQVAHANGIPLIDQYAYLSEMDWKMLMSDSALVHPTGLGYQVKAQYAYSTLRPVVMNILQASP